MITLTKEILQVYELYFHKQIYKTQEKLITKLALVDNLLFMHVKIMMLSYIF